MQLNNRNVIIINNDIITLLLLLFSLQQNAIWRYMAFHYLKIYSA